MSRSTWALLTIIFGESVIVGFFVRNHLAEPRPPIPNLATVDAATVARVRVRSAQCNSPEEWLALARFYHANGFIPESEACYRHAAGKLPDRYEVVFEWAFCLERAGRWEEARRQYQRAAQLEAADVASCWYFIGRNYLREENHQQAEQAFGKAVKLPSARYQLALLKLRAGDQEAAKLLLTPLTREYPRAIGPHLAQYRQSLLDGVPDAASRGNLLHEANQRLPTPLDAQFERVTELCRQHTISHVWTEAQQRIGAGDLDGAAEMLDEALAVQWQRDGADLLSDIAFQQGRAGDAVQLLEEILKVDGASIATLERVGDTYQAMGKLHEAKQAWDRAVGLVSGPLVKNIHYKLSLLHGELENPQEAENHLAHALLTAGIEECQRGHWPRAIGALQQAVKVEPDLAKAWYYLGDAYRHAGNADQARQAFQTCIAKDENFGRAHRALDSLAP